MYQLVTYPSGEKKNFRTLKNAVSYELKADVANSKNGGRSSISDIISDGHRIDRLELANARRVAYLAAGEPFIRM